MFILSVFIVTSCITIFNACPSSCPPPASPPICDQRCPLCRECPSQSQLCADECRFCPATMSSLATCPPVINCPQCPENPQPTTTAAPSSTNEFNCQFVAAKRPITSTNGIPFNDNFAYFDACASGNLATVATMITRYPTIINLSDVRSEGHTCLALSIRRGKQNVFDFLIGQPTIDIHRTNYVDDTSVMHAAFFGNTYMIQKVLDKGDHINAISRVNIRPDGTCRAWTISRTALDWAIWQNHKAAAELLIQRGGKCHCLKTAGCGMYHGANGLGHGYCPSGVATMELFQN